MTSQLIFDLNQQPAMTRESFVRSANNAAALALIDLWPNWDGPLAILTGGEASGKSHIATIWQNDARAKSYSQKQLDEAIFEDARLTAPILIEDVSVMNAQQEKALFHLINMARSCEQYILITSRLQVSHWETKLPDLTSRLMAAQKAEIGPPDDALLGQLYMKLFADRQLRVESDVIGYLIARMERSTAMVRAMVDALDSAALAKNKRVTKVMASEILTEIASKQPKDQFNLL